MSPDEKLVTKFNQDNHLQVQLVYQYSLIKYIIAKL